MKCLPWFILICAGLTACSESTPKTGVMPGIATGGYDAPTNGEAAAAYMAGFQARYDIPELDYPEDIKVRIQNARQKRFARDMNIAETRQKMMAKLALTVMAQKDPEAKDLLKKLKDNPKTTPKASDISQLIAMMDRGPKRQTLTKSEREKIYKGALRDYKYSFRSLKIESCRWTEMTRLIGSGHEQMAFIHGTHPTQGYKCEVEMKTEVHKGYPRLTHFQAFWVKAKNGNWTYYGKFRGVGISPRQLRLDQNLLKDPEGTIGRQSTMDSIAKNLQ